MRTSTEFLDTQQYTQACIKDYEGVWGEGFVSPGGEAKARELLATLDLAPGTSVLDVCCGLGGSAFLMAQEYGCRVDGIDLSTNMVTQARRLCQARGLGGLVNISQTDCLDLDVEAKYDLIYSRDALMHIADKVTLFSNLWRALKPGGRLLLTDYSCAPSPWSDAFADYVAQRGYSLHTLDEYVAIVREAGFQDVQGWDTTDEFVASLKADLVPIDEQGRDDLRAAWEAKQARAEAGEQRWCQIRAVKSLDA